jgi:hypothetical protein
MNFMKSNLNHLNRDSKLNQNKEVVFLNNIFHLLIINNIFWNKKAKNTFHSIESQHFKFINVGFFLKHKIEHQKIYI